MGIKQKLSNAAEKLGSWLSGESPQSQTTTEEPQAVNKETIEAIKEDLVKETQPKEEVKKTEESQKKEIKPLEDSVKTRENIKKSTLSLLNALFLSNQENCNTISLIVWLDTDNFTFNSYSDLTGELETYWNIENGYEFEKVELKQGKPEDEHNARKVEIDSNAISIYLEERKTVIVEETKKKKACVYVFGGKGSLLRDKYELSSEVLVKENRKYYNIGRGEFPEMEQGNYRQNHIAIDDKSDIEYNRYVSRAHARIGFSKNIGFYLQVEIGGSRLSGNRTRILRNDNKIEVENIDVKEPLHNGDFIELGKAVVLKYEEIE